MAAGSSTSSSHPRVLGLNISRGDVGIPLAGGAFEATCDEALIGMMYVESGPYLDAGRNRAMSEALKLKDPDAPNGLKWDWVLFIDSDMVPTSDAIFTLLLPYHTTSADSLVLLLDATKYPVIGGYYVNPYDDGLYPEEGNVGPVVYNWGNYTNVLDHDPERTVPSYRRVSTTYVETAGGLFGSHLLEVGVVGTGFMAIHHSILQPMLDTYGLPTPWFAEPIINERLYGEDLGFCFRLMEMDYPVLLNRACRVSHNKTITLTPPPSATPTGDTTVPGV